MPIRRHRIAQLTALQQRVWSSSSCSSPAPASSAPQVGPQQHLKAGRLVSSHSSTAVEPRSSQPHRSSISCRPSMGASRRVLAAVACCGSVRALLAPLAYPSRLPLPPLPVKQVCIAPKQPEDDLTDWNAKIRRRAAQRGWGHRKGTATVVFPAKPSQSPGPIVFGSSTLTLNPRNRVSQTQEPTLFCGSVLRAL